MNWHQLATDILHGHRLTAAEGLAILESPDDELLALLDAGFMLRRHYFGYGVRVQVLRNARQGGCGEDCAFCSQSRGAASGVTPRALQTAAEIVAGAREAVAVGAYRYCIVTAGGGPIERDLDVLCDAVRRIKAEMELQICTSLGFVSEDQVRRLKEAGVNRFNHNLETSRNYYPEICHTHRWEDRVATARRVKAAGLELCSGGLLGLGESLTDRVDLALSMSSVAADSIPVNFLDPRPGTPLADRERLPPRDCLRALVLFRFANPATEIRAAGGREVCLRQLQPLALYVANSIFSNGYLTTGGANIDSDRAMIEDAGFFVEHYAVE